MTRLETAQMAYFKAFDAPPPEPFNVNQDRVAAVLEDAIAKGKPIPDSFDWWAHLPPGAVA
jgi:hypothetical protein